MKLPWQRWVGTVYRAHNPRWSYEPESGAGASRHGGRFNPPGTPALYTSLSPETAWLEAQQGFAFKAQPLTLCAYQVDCQSVLDLTLVETRRSVDLNLVDLNCAWEAQRDAEPPSWIASNKLHSAGTAAIIVPSFASHSSSDDINMVFWKWSSELPYCVKVIDDLDRLPRNDLSWR